MSARDAGPTESGPTAQDPVVAQLEKSHGPVCWSDLQAHADRNSLFLFEGDDALLQVAIALARNSVDEVRTWQQSGALRRPTLAELEKWQAKPATAFDSIVVQPFVLVRELSGA